jgi:hypothetical protein
LLCGLDAVACCEGGEWVGFWRRGHWMGWEGGKGRGILQVSVMKCGG